MSASFWPFLFLSLSGGFFTCFDGITQYIEKAVPIDANNLKCSIVSGKWGKL